MAAGLHGSARTTPRISAELQASQETTRSLAARYGLNPKTVAKWRYRTTTADQQMGPSRPRSALHRCLVRHGISRLPQGEEKASQRKRFAQTRIGFVHIDVCELRLAQGKLFMFSGNQPSADG